MNQRDTINEEASLLYKKMIAINCDPFFLQNEVDKDLFCLLNEEGFDVEENFYSLPNEEYIPKEVDKEEFIAIWKENNRKRLYQICRVCKVIQYCSWPKYYIIHLGRMLRDSGSHEAIRLYAECLMAMD